jgi:glycosyltransferase involved in cell wall biosynthesis
VKPSVSIVLLAWNEEDAITAAIEDCRAFAREHLADHEIIVVDDGSRDRTRQRAVAAGARVIVHAENQGMGASMRDGYLAARMDYMAHLPGDRQVRAEALLPMLPLCGRDRVVVSVYENAPSGPSRAVMSTIFRLLTRHVGRLRIDFAGTYLFHRDWLRELDLSRAHSDTFLFSFQLLELLRRAGAEFHTVTVRTHPRETGVSREATLGRIAKMLVEIMRARI